MRKRQNERFHPFRCIDVDAPRDDTRSPPPSAPLSRCRNPFTRRPSCPPGAWSFPAPPSSRSRMPITLNDQPDDAALGDQLAQLQHRVRRICHRQPASPAGSPSTRVANPVEFYGRLTANGQIFLISPGGVHVRRRLEHRRRRPGRDHAVACRNADFEAGRYVFIERRQRCRRRQQRAASSRRTAMSRCSGRRSRTKASSPRAWARLPSPRATRSPSTWSATA